MEQDWVLLLLGAIISLVSLLAGVVTQYLLDIRKMRMQFEHDERAEASREERVNERQILEELGRLSARLPNDEVNNLIGQLDLRERAIFIAARLRTRNDRRVLGPQIHEQDPVACSRCGGAIDPAASFCPACGEPQPKTPADPVPSELGAR